MRNINNLIRTKMFEEAWNNSNESQQSKALKCIDDCDKASLYRWMMMHESIHFGDKTWQALIEHAKIYKIKNYSRMDKLQLMRELERAKNVEACKESGSGASTVEQSDGTPS